MQHTQDADLLRMGSNGPSLALPARGSSPGPGAAAPQPPRRSTMMTGKKLLLVAGLGALSWISTYSGMLELIQSNMGDLDLVMKIAIGGSVAMLMLMIIWLLDQLFDENNAVTIRAVYALGYVFLTLISIGFSFGFYWKFLESRTEASRSAESAISQVQASMTNAETRLTQLQSTFEGLAAISTQKAADEIATGRSCPNSRPGDGPRRRLREADAASLTLASQFVKERAAVIRKDLAGLNDDIQKIVKQDKSTFDPKTGTRNEFMRAMNRKLDLVTSGFNSFRNDPQLRQFRGDFAERAEKTVFPDEQGKTFACPDAQLQAGLRGGVKAIDSLPIMTKPEIATVEGAEATVEAFRRLLVTMTSLATFKLPATPDDIRSEQAKAIQSLGSAAPAPIVSEQSAGLGKRDWVPLLIAVFVDLCLLLVSIPPAVSAAERTRRRRQAATGDGYRTIADLSAIHADEETLKQLEPLRHIAFDRWGQDYVAVPMIAGKNAMQPPEPRRDPNGWLAYFSGRDEDDETPVPPTLTDRDLWEAQFLANLFASHERLGPYKRVYAGIVPVRAKLKEIGSKWQNIKTFRLYRFKKGAWSDFVLDVIVGADRALAPVRVAQEQARLAKVELKSQEIVHQVELKESEFKAQLDEQRDVAGTRRKMREIAAEHEQLKIDIEREKLEKERQALRNDLARQTAVDAEQFGSYVPGEDRDPDGLTLRTRRGPVVAPREANTEIVALMQSVSQQALATQEIARQQTAFMQEMAKTLATLARNQAEVAPQPTAAAFANAALASAPGAAVNGTNGVHSFAAAYAQREPSLDTSRNAQREARLAHESPIVVPLHSDRTVERSEIRLAPPSNGKDDAIPDRANPLASDNTAHFGHAVHGNTALSLQPAAQATAPLPALGYGLSRLLGRDWSRGSHGGDVMSQGFGRSQSHVHPGVRFEDRPIEPMVADAIDVSSGHSAANGDPDRVPPGSGFLAPELNFDRASEPLRRRWESGSGHGGGHDWSLKDDESDPSSTRQIEGFVEAVRSPLLADDAADQRKEPALGNETGIEGTDDVGAFAIRYASKALKRKRRPSGPKP